MNEEKVLSDILKELQNIRAILEYECFPKEKVRRDSAGKAVRDNEGKVIRDPQNPEEFLESLRKDLRIDQRY